MKTFIDFNKKLKQQARNGVALLMSLFFVVIMTFLATSISYDTLIEYNVSARSIHKVRAYYAAKSGLEIALLRILIFQKVIALIPDDADIPDIARPQVEAIKQKIDLIWQFPFAWPISSFIPEDLGNIEKGEVKAIEEESIFEGSYQITIQDEGGKIDINDLGSGSKKIREATTKQLLKIFEIEMENNTEFADKYGSTDFNELVNNIKDWVDDDKISDLGGDEKSNFDEVLDQFEDSNTDEFPPNQAFRTIEELYMIPGMNNEFFNMLKSRVTIYGIKGININTAEKDVIKSLDSQITDELVDAIQERINDPEQGGPFQNDDDFEGFLENPPKGQGINIEDFNEEGIPLLFGNEHNFVVKSIGTYGGISREITAVTFDLDNIKERYIKLLEEDDEEEKNEDEDDNDTGNNNDQNPNDPNNSNNNNDQNKNTTKAKKKTPKGRPTIVFMTEN